MSILESRLHQAPKWSYITVMAAKDHTTELERTPPPPPPPLAVEAVPADPAGDVAGQRAPRQERGRRRVDEILDAAEALIAEVGPAAVSIQELARRAGASVGSIYHFFPHK